MPPLHGCARNDVLADLGQGERGLIGRLVLIVTPDRPAKLLDVARSIAAADTEFQAVCGPRKGVDARHAFMRELRRSATEAFGLDSQKRLCDSTAFAALSAAATPA